MATSKLLQIPKIIEIIGSTIRIAHPIITNNISVGLGAEINAAGTTMTVKDNNGFADDDWFIIGSPGDSQTEECDVNGVPTRGTSLTVTNTLKFGHGLDDMVTKIYERGIKIYGAATDGGAGTLIASIDAFTTPIADAVMVQWNQPYTQYTLISTDTTYAYYFAKFTDGTTDSSASVYVPSTGVTYNVLEPLINRSYVLTGLQKNDHRFTPEMMVEFAQDCQEAISQFVYQDPQSGSYQQKDWSHEVIRDTSSLITIRNENTYALSALTYPLKYPNSDKSIINIQLGTEAPLAKMAIADFDLLMRGTARSNLNGAATAGDTSITVISTVDFADSGSLYVGSNIITYTAKTATTFTGIPATGTGSIQTTVASGAVWQNAQPGKPTRYVIYNGYIYLDRPVHEDFAGQVLKVRYFKALTRLTNQSSALEIPFTNVFPLFLSAKIEYRNDNTEKAQEWMQQFNKQVLNNALADYIPITDEWQYFNFDDGVYSQDYTIRANESDVLEYFTL